MGSNFRPTPEQPCTTPMWCIKNSSTVWDFRLGTDKTNPDLRLNALLPPYGCNLRPTNFNQAIPLCLRILSRQMFSALQQCWLSIRHPPSIIHKNMRITRIRLLIPMKSHCPITTAIGQPTLHTNLGKATYTHRQQNRRFQTIAPFLPKPRNL